MYGDTIFTGEYRTGDTVSKKSGAYRIMNIIIVQYVVRSNTMQHGYNTDSLWLVGKWQGTYVALYSYKNNM